MMFRRVTATITLITLLSATILVPDVAKADQYDNYIAAGQQHNIISNADFIDINSMSTADIQSFLVSQGSYLKDYIDNSAVGGGRSAALIIYDASHGLYDAAVGPAYGVTIDSTTGTINPQVILVTLQKEQSLISKTSRNDVALNKAMGYGCPGGGCDPKYAGFAMQVGWGAWQLRLNYEIAVQGWNDYRVGNTVTMGTSRTPPSSYQVTLANQATAAAYRYTPYVFFGNYNLWNLYYNTYNFDVYNGEVTGSNDTSDYSRDSYDNSLSISGGKVSNIRAYYGATLLSNIGSTSWSLTFEPQHGGYNYYIDYKNTNGTTVARKKMYIIRHKMGDINVDGRIDIIDLAILAENWNKSNPPNRHADFNSDNIVNITDLAILAEKWGW